MSQTNVCLAHLRVSLISIYLTNTLTTLAALYSACSKFIEAHGVCDISYRIAWNCCWVQSFVIYTDRPVSAKRKLQENDDVIMCVHWYKLVPVWTRWLSTVCLSSKWLLLRRISLLLYKMCKRCSRVVEVESAVLNPSVQQASFLPTMAVLIFS